MAAAPRKRARSVQQKGPQPDWQVKMGTIECQNIYAMEKEIWTDCSFLVGKPDDKVEEICCHKYQLAKSSAVFADALFGEQALKDPNQIFELDSITPAVFKAFLRYAYTGKVKYTGVYAESWELLNFGKRFRLPEDMLDQCRGHLWAYMGDGWNAWTALQYLSMCEDERRLQLIAELRMKSTLNWENGKLMKDFLDLPEEAVIFLLRSDELNVDEAALIRLCCKWAKHKVTGGRTEGPDNTPVTPDPEAYKAALDPMIPYFRYLAVNDNDWKQLSGEESRLPKSVIDNLDHYKARATKYDFDLPESYSRNTNQRKMNTQNVYVYGIRPDDEDIFTNMLTMEKVYKLFVPPGRQRMNNANDDEMKVKIPTQVRPVEERSTTYEEDITIVLVSPNYDMVLFKSRFTSLVNYDTIMSVPMKLPARMNKKAYSAYESNYVLAIPHKSGIYPPGWFSISALSYNFKKMEQILQKGSMAAENVDIYKWQVENLQKKYVEQMKSKSKV